MSVKTAVRTDTVGQFKASDFRMFDIVIHEATNILEAIHQDLNDEQKDDLARHLCEHPSLIVARTMRKCGIRVSYFEWLFQEYDEVVKFRALKVAAVFVDQQDYVNNTTSEKIAMLEDVAVYGPIDNMTVEALCQRMSMKDPTITAHMCELGNLDHVKTLVRHGASLDPNRCLKVGPSHNIALWLCAQGGSTKIPGLHVFVEVRCNIRLKHQFRRELCQLVQMYL